MLAALMWEAQLQGGQLALKASAHSRFISLMLYPKA